MRSTNRAVLTPRFLLALEAVPRSTALFTAFNGSPVRAAASAVVKKARQFLPRRIGLHNNILQLENIYHFSARTSKRGYGFVAIGLLACRTGP